MCNKREYTSGSDGWRSTYHLFWTWGKDGRRLGPSELATLILDQQPLCTTFTNVKSNFELKFSLIHLLPIVCYCVGETHSWPFIGVPHIIYSKKKPHGVIQEQINLRDFLLSLNNQAKDWLYFLLLGSVTMWNEMKRLFLNKLFLAFWVANIRRRPTISHKLLGDSSAYVPIFDTIRFLINSLSNTFIRDYFKWREFMNKIASYYF